MNSSLRNVEQRLLIDIGAGVVLDAPPQAVMTRRWSETHPFVRLEPGRLYAGPDAVRPGPGEYVVYKIEREVAGNLHLRRES